MTLLYHARFAVWDTETTGMDPATDRVVEVASVVCTTTEILGSAGTLVNPMRAIPPEASAVHHIVDRHVAGCATLEYALLEFADLLSCPPAAYVAHNAAFDSAFLPMLRKAPWLCTMRLARHLLPDIPKHTNQCLRYSLGLDVPEAEGLAAHRATADAAVTARVLMHLLTLLPAEITTVEQLVAFASRPCLLKNCHFGKHRNTPWSEVPRDYLQWLAKSEGFAAMDSDIQGTVRHWLGVRT